MRKRKTGIILLFLTIFFVVAGAALANNDKSGAELQAVFEEAGLNSVIDLGIKSRYQDAFGGIHKRGRANIAADFNLDGHTDFYIGNPGDDSFVLTYRENTNGNKFRYQFTENLLSGELTWGAVSFDYDNDGDYDLFIPTGANEGIGIDFLFKNMLIETGTLHFVDVTDEAGVAGPVPPGETDPIEVASANAVVADYDQDGDDDIFVSVNIHGSSQQGSQADLEALWADPSLQADSAIFADCSVTLDNPSHAEILGRNILWQNNGDGTFTDVTDAVGLGNSFEKTRHSTFFDFDNDGDVDLFENNFYGPQILYQNMIVETGNATFTDVTSAMSSFDDISYPERSFASAAADFNNDGWEDIMFFSRGPAAQSSPYPDGNAIFINQAGAGFVNVAPASGVNDDFIIQQGVMGCMVGDVNGDGTPDVYVGNGGPPSGQFDRFYLSTSDDPLTYQNATAVIDFPAPEWPSLNYPTYPYRTHGTTFVDVDNDGILEILVVNGGPAHRPITVREPNRLFKFDWAEPYNYFKIRPVGDNVTVAKDAVGTRFALTVSEGGTNTRTIYRTLFAGSCFSAQNGFEVHFGIGQADTISELQITWPDGSVEVITTGLNINDSIVVEK